MTWLSTWPRAGIPQYTEHATETAAEAHAHELVQNGTTTVAVIFQLVRPDEESTT